MDVVDIYICSASALPGLRLRSSGYWARKALAAVNESAKPIGGWFFLLGKWVYVICSSCTDPRRYVMVASANPLPSPILSKTFMEFMNVCIPLFFVPVPGCVTGTLLYKEWSLGDIV